MNAPDIMNFKTFSDNYSINSEKNHLHRQDIFENTSCFFILFLYQDQKQN